MFTCYLCKKTNNLWKIYLAREVEEMNILYMFSILFSVLFENCYLRTKCLGCHEKITIILKILILCKKEIKYYTHTVYCNCELSKTAFSAFVFKF